MKKSAIIALGVVMLSCGRQNNSVILTPPFTTGDVRITTTTADRNNDLASPWTAPKWIEAFQNEGIEIYAMTPQNKPLNRGNSASIFMGWEEQRNFIKNELGSAFR
ncbi:MAG: hypothetical protein HDS22_02790 [Bacteroides sp.]|nr:hypothetical protein [Bacteroides sp.]